MVRFGLTRRRVRLTGIAALLLLAVAAAGAAGGWWLANRFVIGALPDREATVVKVPAYASAGDVSMPDVRGLSAAEAAQVVADAGIPASAVTTTKRPSAATAGTVVAQTPAFGAASPTAVALVISAGATMPDLVGQEAAAATDTLDDLGARVERAGGYDPGKAAGVVLSTAPAAGGELEGAVRVTVNEAPTGRYLSTLDAIDGGCSTDDSLVLDGTVSQHGMTCSAGSRDDPRSTAWLLQKAVDRVTGVVGVADREDPGTSVHVRIRADSRTVFDATVGYGAPARLDVRTSHALRLTVEVWTTGSATSTTPAAAFGDVQLLGSSAEMARLPER